MYNIIYNIYNIIINTYIYIYMKSKCNIEIYGICMYNMIYIYTYT